MKEWFVIKNLEDFTDKARSIVFNNFGVWDDASTIDIMIDTVKDEEQAELDKVLSHKESVLIIKNIAKKQKNKTTKKNRYVINEDLFVEIVESLNNRMISNILQSLVSKGLIESSYDSDINDFVFWVKEHEEKKDKPQTD